MKVSIQRIAIKDLEANPYRHIEKYQIDQSKIDRLLASYTESGFWDGSIQVRPHPKRSGKYQLAFGHHRTEAARRAGLKEIGVVVGNRDNATMLRMMASENAEEFKHSPLVTQETIGAVIEAYGADEIALEVPEDLRGGKGGVYKTQLQDKPYTLPMVARFLGWVQADGQPTRNCRIAFEAWHAAHDLGVDVRKYQQQLRAENDELLTNKATQAILTSVRSAQRQAERAGASPAVVKQAAQAAAKDTVERIKEDNQARRTKDQAGMVGAASAQKVLQRAGIRVDPKAPPSLPDFVATTADWIRDRVPEMLTRIEQRVDAVLPFRDQLSEAACRELVRSLRRAADDTQRSLSKRADALERRTVRNVTPTPRKRLTA